MKQFTSVKDVTDINALVQQALALKKSPFAHEQLGRHKTLVLLFFNPSLRTRISTQKAAQHLGMNVISMNAAQGWQLEFEDGAVMLGDRSEHIKEAAGVISQYADIIGIRSFPKLDDREKDYQDLVLHQFIKHASVPIVSLESATRHPLQSLADLMTIEEHKKTERPKVVLSWAPHPRALPQAVPNSFVEWMKEGNVELVVTHPKGAELAPEFSSGVTVEYDQKKAFEGADFIYAKNWSSYKDYGKIISQKEDWIITDKKMKWTNEARFMHCLPVRRNVVVADEVLDSDYSIVLEQANNRTFSAQAVLKSMLESL